MRFCDEAQWWIDDTNRVYLWLNNKVLKMRLIDTFDKREILLHGTVKSTTWPILVLRFMLKQTILEFDSKIAHGSSTINSVWLTLMNQMKCLFSSSK